MVRNGFTLLFLAGVCAAACGTTVHKGTGLAPEDGGNPATGDGGHATAATKCVGQCCPADNSCYSDTTKGNGSYGSECFATRDNSLTPNRIQMRETWLNPTSPVGLTQPVVYSSLNAFATLPWSTCGLAGGSGYIELVDFDLDNGVSRVGFSTYLGTGKTATPAEQAEQDAKTKAAVTAGLCMAASPSWKGTATFANGTTEPLAIDQAALYTGKDLKVPVDGSTTTFADYPVGLPQPMGQPWTVGPNRAKRLDVDFDLTAPPIAAFAPDGADLTQWKTQREELLAQLDKATGAYAKANFDGVFFFDNTTKHSHGYSPVGWQILYDTGTATAYELIPIREAEITSDFNDPKYPNCVGQYDGNELVSTTCVPGLSPTNDTGPSNAWAGPDGVYGKAPGKTSGYFLTVELEQIWSNVLKQTLCQVYPTGPVALAAGWGTADKPLCRVNPKFLPDAQGNPTTTPGPVWNAKDPINGIPTGDWCSLDNSPAHGTCHDAYHTVAYQAFAGTNIQDGTCDVTSTTGTATPGTATP